MHHRTIHFSCLVLACTSLITPWHILHTKLSGKEQTFVTKHTLPYNNPMNKKLNAAFSHEKDIAKALKVAGFIFLRDHHQIVAQHSAVPGYLVKALPAKSYKMTILSNNLNVRRIAIAEQIRTIIKEHKYYTIVVPQKYLYHVPGKGSSLNDSNYIVVVEKLDLIEDEEENKKRLQNLTQQERDAIYAIVKKAGLYDARANNIVLTKQGQIAFIDTEPRWQFNNIPLLGKWLKRFLGKQGIKRLYQDLSRAISITEYLCDEEEEIQTLFTFLF